MKKNKIHMPMFVSHKTVRAFKIGQIVTTAKGVILRSHGSLESVIEQLVGKRYLRRYNPKVGGYFVRHRRGRTSWSSAEAFESSYTLKEENEPAGINERAHPSLSAAITAYNIWRARYPKEKIRGTHAPTAEVLFREKEYEYHAAAWLESAAKATKLK